MNNNSKYYIVEEWSDGDGNFHDLYKGNNKQDALKSARENRSPGYTCFLQTRINGKCISEKRL